MSINIECSPFACVGLFVYLNTGDGFDNGKQWQANLACIKIDKQPLLISLWIAVKDSIN
jgi:hypothetical protein